MDVAVLVYDGFDELDAIGPFEVFQNAANAGADCTTTLCTVAETATVEASHGLRIEAEETLGTEPAGWQTQFDLMIVPGGGWNGRGKTGAWAEAERGVIPRLIADYAERGTAIAGVCTGGMILARAGVLEDRPAVTHASALDELAETDATVVDARVVDDGEILTAGGVTAGVDLAFHLIQREFGSAIANAVGTEMEYEPSEQIYTR